MGGLSRRGHSKSKVQPVHVATQVTQVTPACVRELFALRRLATLARARKVHPALPNSNEAWALPDLPPFLPAASNSSPPAAIPLEIRHQRRPEFRIAGKP